MGTSGACSPDCPRSLPPLYALLKPEVGTRFPPLELALAGHAVALQLLSPNFRVLQAGHCLREQLPAKSWRARAVGNRAVYSFWRSFLPLCQPRLHQSSRITRPAGSNGK